MAITIMKPLQAVAFKGEDDMRNVSPERVLKNSSSGLHYLQSAIG